MSIYDIYGWMGVVGKYTGCIPLPGVYEKREWSKCTKAFINYVIPALNFSFFLYDFATSAPYYIGNRKPESLIDFLVLISTLCFCAHWFLCIVFNHFYLRRDLVSYLKLFSKIDELLKPKKRQLKRFLSLFFVLFIAFYTVFLEIQIITMIGLRKYFQRYYDDPAPILKYQAKTLSKRFIFSIAIYAHPYLMYICFQRVLKSAFDQLLEKIKENRNKNLSGEKRVKKLKKYVRLYRDLCELCARLDHLVSPLLLIQFTFYYLSEIEKFALVFALNFINSLLFYSIFTGFFVLFLVSNFAYLTKKAHDKILPALYSTFNSDKKAVKIELKNFALQSIYFNKSFSASGFVKLDRDLILAIIQSLISQVVVFLKIYKE